MKYNSKLILHIPLYPLVDNKLIATVYLDFQEALIHQIQKACNCRLELGAIQVRKYGRTFDEAVLIVFCDSEDVPMVTNIFLHLICEYHSDLVSEEYQYEIGDTLITISGVDAK